MWTTPLQWLRRVYDAASGADETRSHDRDGTDPACLYECPECGTVYISDDPHPCSDCEREAEHVPNEQDLGISPHEYG